MKWKEIRRNKKKEQKKVVSFLSFSFFRLRFILQNPHHLVEVNKCIISKKANNKNDWKQWHWQQFIYVLVLCCCFIQFVWIFLLLNSQKKITRKNEWKEMEVNVKKEWINMWDEWWDGYVKQEKFLKEIMKLKDVKLNEKFWSIRRKKW